MILNENYLKIVLRTLGWQLKNDNKFDDKRVKCKNNDLTPEKGLFVQIDLAGNQYVFFIFYESISEGTTAQI